MPYHSGRNTRQDSLLIALSLICLRCDDNLRPHAYAGTHHTGKESHPSRLEESKRRNAAVTHTHVSKNSRTHAAKYTKAIKSMRDTHRKIQNNLQELITRKDGTVIHTHSGTQACTHMRTHTRKHPHKNEEGNTQLKDLKATCEEASKILGHSKGSSRTTRHGSFKISRSCRQESNKNPEPFDQQLMNKN